MAKHSADILEWARRGAEARWQQLQAEMASLLDTFPHLGGAARGRGGRRANSATSALGGATATPEGRARGGRSVAQGAGGDAATRKRSKMTAAQKKAVSLRMKKYWADRRKASAKA
jgi:hypothetical protein